MIVGVTGLMGAGKSTLCNEIISLDNSFIYLDVDKFRHELFSKKSYTEELSDALSNKINNYKDLNKIIYNNNSKMIAYKNILYKYLRKHIEEQNEKLIVEWALIIQDDIQDMFDKLIIVDRTIDDILLNNFNDLSKKEVKERLDLQKYALTDKKIIIPYIIHKNTNNTINFIYS